MWYQVPGHIDTRVQAWQCRCDGIGALVLVPLRWHWVAGAGTVADGMGALDLASAVVRPGDCSVVESPQLARGAGAQA